MSPAPFRSSFPQYHYLIASKSSSQPTFSKLFCRFPLKAVLNRRELSSKSEKALRRSGAVTLNPSIFVFQWGVGVRGSLRFARESSLSKSHFTALQQKPMTRRLPLGLPLYPSLLTPSVSGRPALSRSLQAPHVPSSLSVQH